MDIKRFENFVPSGWVNVKLDEELHIRIARYVESLDTLLSPIDKYNLFKKIELLSDKGKIIDADIRTKISIVTILQYLKEIKDKFNPSSSGFLLEGFLAALIHGEIISDNGYSDIRSRTPEKYIKKDISGVESGSVPIDKFIGLSYNELTPVKFKTKGGSRNNQMLNYQIKLYKDGSPINVTWGADRCDYYVICVKSGGSITVRILDGKDEDDDSFIGKFCTYRRGVPVKINDRLNPEAYERVDGKSGTRKYITVSSAKLKTLFSKEYTKVLDFGIMQDVIDSCGDDIKKSIESVYNHLSELHYNIDSLVSGYNKERDKVDIDTASENSIKSSNDIIEEVSKLNKGLI